MAPTPKRITRKRRERIAKVMGLREIGLSYEEIAEKLNISKGTAYADVNDGLNLAITEPAENVRKLELRRLDQLNKIAMAIAVNRHFEHATRLNAIDRVLRVQDRRAKLLGLDKQTPNQNADNVAEILRTFLNPTQNDSDTLT